MTALFFRDGTPFTGKPFKGEKGGPFTVLPTKCNRCGGAGGSDKWAHTGWTCFDCGGNGRGPNRTYKLYDADKLAKLNAAADKRAAKKAAAAEAARITFEAEVAARKEAFLAAHGALVARAEPFKARSMFIADVINRAIANCTITDKQAAVVAAAIDKIEAEDAAKAASGFVGTIGKRLKNVPVTVVRIASYDRARLYGYGAFETVWIVTMRDEAGNAIVSKTPRFRPDVGEKLVISATVKEHSEFNGEKQTIVQRIVAHEQQETA